ncbi:protoporphyrinogen oxidase [Oceanithermus sp.]
MKRVMVVGGGLAGLAAAYEARQRGAEVTLLEKERLGGKVRTIREDGFVIETGPDAVVRYKPWALALARELGLEASIVGTLPSRPAAYIRVRGRNHELPEGLNVVIPSKLGPLARTSLFSPLGKFRAALDLFLPRGPEGDEAFGRFIRRRLGAEVWENLAAPLTGGIYGGDPENLSLLAAFPMLKELERKHRSLILGSLAAMKKRKTSREGGSLFASFTGGQAQLVDALVAHLNGSLRVGETATAIEPAGGGWRIESDKAEYEAEVLVLALPAPAAADLLEPLGFAATNELRAIPYHSAATVTLAFDKSSFPERRGHGVLFARSEGFHARGFTWLDQKWPHRAPEGIALCRAYFSGSEADAGEEKLLEAALADLERLLGVKAAPERVWIDHFPRGMPAYTVGHLDRLRAIEAAEKELAGLALVGAAYRGVGIPEVIRDGRRAVSELLEG